MIFSREYIGYLSRRTVKHLQDVKLIHTNQAALVEERDFLSGEGGGGRHGCGMWESGYQKPEGGLEPGQTGGWDRGGIFAERGVLQLRK